MTFSTGSKWSTANWSMRYRSVRELNERGLFGLVLAFMSGLRSQMDVKKERVLLGWLFRICLNPIGS